VTSSKTAKAFPVDAAVTLMVISIPGRVPFSPASAGMKRFYGDLNPGQGDFLTGVCRDEKVLGLRHNGLQLRG
jgi:hypothetical protein